MPSHFPPVGDITFEAGFVTAAVVYPAWHVIVRRGAAGRVPAAGLTPGR